MMSILHFGELEDLGADGGQREIGRVKEEGEVEVWMGPRGGDGDGTQMF
jgi:hypothetical protein